MKEMIRLALILAITATIAAGTLAFVNLKTKPKIEEQRRLALQRALTTALPQAKNGVIVPVVKDGEVDYYIGYAQPDTTQLVGYAFVARGVGYSSTIETLVGVDSTGTILGVKVLFQLETPGLGSRIEEITYGETQPWFQVQFVGKKARDVAVDKDGGEIHSVTGATISSRAVTNSIRKGYEALMKKIRLAEISFNL